MTAIGSDHGEIVTRISIALMKSAVSGGRDLVQWYPQVRHHNLIPKHLRLRRARLTSVKCDDPPVARWNRTYKHFPQYQWSS